MWKIVGGWIGQEMSGSNPSMHRHVPFHLFPKVYTKHNKTPHSPAGETGGNTNEN